jgi:hypothetical protein
MINRHTHVRGFALVLGFAAATFACGSSGDGEGSGGNGSGNSGGNGSGASGNSGGSGNGSGSGSGSGSGVPTPFPGSGSADDPLTPGCGPSTADQCGGTCEASGGDDTTVIRPPAVLCFAGAEDPTPDNPTAIIEQVIETIDGVSMVHLRIVFDPSFVDNTYGVNAVGWGGDETTEPMMPGMEDGPKPPKKKGGGHTWNDLVGSDHVELLLTDGNGNTVMDFKIDYVSEDPSSPCGYGSLGIDGGEGKVIVGDGSAVLDVATSIDRNLNGCGYCEIVDSPATDANYTPNPDAPNWDYRVVYEVWIALEAFGSAGFGQAYIENVHASPSKLATNTVEVFASPCPETWDTPFCPPELVQPDGSCATETGECPPNWEVYVASEGVVTCTPIPFSNYPDMQPCPEGYMLDPATEGRFCVPIAG